MAGFEAAADTLIRGDKVKIKKCPICAYDKGALDEHLEHHHNNHDVARILDAIIGSLGKEGANAVEQAQADNMKNLKHRLKKQIGKLN